jgi:hypothetical protein
LLSFCTGCGSTAPNSNGQRRPPINLRSRTTFPRVAGKQRPCRDAGVGAIAPGFAMLARAKRASHIDPPPSSYAIMRRACPYRGENPGPGKDVTESLTPRPELENDQDPTRKWSVHRSSRGLTPDQLLVYLIGIARTLGR